MREILFRGKRIDNGEFVCGSLSMEYFDECGCIMISPTSDTCYKVAPETVGQFTGLTENGTKIFEGDIGRYKQTDGAKRNGNQIMCTGKVIYNAKTASYAVESRDEAGCKYFDYFPIKDFEVIGNIHDNPELVGVER